MKSIQMRSYAGLIGIILLFVVVNVVSSQLFRNFRIDLTEEKLYTLSNGSKKIISDIIDPLSIKYYFSSTDGASIPVFKNYGERVQDFLESYTRLSDHLKLELFDPRPDSEEAEWAENFGLSAVPIATGDTLFCGLVILNEMGDDEVIPFFDSGREEFLEYDISKAIASISTPVKTVIGIYSPLNLEGTKNPYMNPPGAQNQETEPWYFLNDLKQMYDVKILDNLSVISEEINLLILIHPKNLNDEALYAFDQYIMSGKNALLYVDPFCESDTSAPAQQNPMMQMQMNMSRNSSLPKTLINAGLQIPEGKIILDRDRATQVQTAPGQVSEYYAWLNLTSEETSNDDTVTAQLESLILPTTGYLIYSPKEKNSDLIFTPLIESSSTANPGNTSMLMFGGTPQKIASSFIAGTGKLPIAARLTGTFKTAFPNGKPEVTTADEQKNDDKPSKTGNAKHLSESKHASQLIIVSDVDMISNRFSLRINNLFGNLIVSPLNDNLNFFFNAVENLTGSANLSSIRSRGTFSRPFTRVAKIEAEAALKWMSEEKALTQKVEEVSAKINSLLSTDDNPEGMANQAVLNEIKLFRNEKIQVAKKLRDVRKNLRQEKEALGNQIFLINTFLIPIIILLYGLYTLIIGKPVKA